MSYSKQANRTGLAFAAIVITLVGTLVNPATGASIRGINNGVLWLDAGSLNLNDGDTVNLWNNSATGGGIAGNAVLDNSDPSYVANAINGLPAVAFDNGGGSNAAGDSMRVDNFQSTFVDNKPFTVFMVSLAESTAFGPTPTSRQGSINRFYPRRDGLTYQTGNPNPREDISIASVSNRLEITAFQHTGSQIEAWLNGESQGTASIGLGNIGGDQPLYLSWWPADTPRNGQLLELMWFDRALTPAEFDAISGYLSGKYFVPEPSSALVWSLLGLAFARRPNRRRRGLRK